MQEPSSVQTLETRGGQVFGRVLSAIPAVLEALFMPFPTVICVLVFFVAIQQIESNVRAPVITAHAVGLDPLGAIDAVPLAGRQSGTS